MRRVNANSPPWRATSSLHTRPVGTSRERYATPSHSNPGSVVRLSYFTHRIFLPASSRSSDSAARISVSFDISLPSASYVTVTRFASTFGSRAIHFVTTRFPVGPVTVDSTLSQANSLPAVFTPSSPRPSTFSLSPGHASPVVATTHFWTSAPAPSAFSVLLSNESVLSS